MYLEDALFYVSIDDSVPDAELAGWCRAAAAGGVDFIEAPPLRVAAVIDVCRSEDLLLAVTLDGVPDCAPPQADAAVVCPAVFSIGMARSMAGAGMRIGARVDNLNDALLAVETGCDFVVYEGGTDAAAVFGALRTPGIPLYAGGGLNLDDVKTMTGDGLFRFCLQAAVLGGIDAVTGRAAAVSRMLGREM